MRIWSVMDDCIRTGVSTSETTLPGRLRLRRRAPMLYRRLMRGYVPSASSRLGYFSHINAISFLRADVVFILALLAQIFLRLDLVGGQQSLSRPLDPTRGQIAPAHGRAPRQVEGSCHSRGRQGSWGR